MKSGHDGGKRAFTGPVLAETLGHSRPHRPAGVRQCRHGRSAFTPARGAPDGLMTP